MKQPSRSPPPVFLAVLFTLLGLGVIGIGFFVVLGAIGSYSWASTPGEVFQSVITEHDRVDRHTRQNYYVANVAYSYSVGGVEYTSTRIRFGQVSSGFRSHAEYWTNKYKAGASTTAYYNPRNPAESVLERGVSLGAFFPLGCGLLFLAVGLYLLSLRLRHFVR
jgi:hypothetical protein